MDNNKKNVLIYNLSDNHWGDIINKIDNFNNCDYKYYSVNSYTRPGDSTLHKYDCILIIPKYNEFTGIYNKNKEFERIISYARENNIPTFITYHTLYRNDIFSIYQASIGGNYTVNGISGTSDRVGYGKNSNFSKLKPWRQNNSVMKESKIDTTETVEIKVPYENKKAINAKKSNNLDKRWFLCMG